MPPAATHLSIGSFCAFLCNTDDKTDGLQVDNRVSIKAHVGRKLMLRGTEVAAEFVEVPTTVLTSGAEGLALEALREEKLDSLPGDSENFRAAFASLQELIGQAHEYVTAVVEGRREPDVSVGRCAVGSQFID